MLGVLSPMKQIIFFVLVAFLLIGLYFNFFFTPDTALQQAEIDQDSESVEDTETDEEAVDEELEEEPEEDVEEADPDEELSDDESENEEESEEESENEEESEEEVEYNTTFQNEELNALYQEKVDNGETLNISLQLPPYFNADALIERLNEAFDDENINFESESLEASSLNLSSIFVDNSFDVVMFNAMQVTDFDIQILHNRTLGNIEQVYQDLVNQEFIVYLIGDPDIYENENLSQALEDDYEYFTDNDFNYIHLNDTAEGLFENQLNEATLDNVADTFYETLAE